MSIRAVQEPPGLANSHESQRTPVQASPTLIFCWLLLEPEMPLLIGECSELGMAQRLDPSLHVSEHVLHSIAG
jgi:hypothetical protein